MLEAQPWRLSAQGNLTDMYTLEEFRAIRQEDGSFMNYQAMPISLAEPGGQTYMKKLITRSPSEWGWMDVAFNNDGSNVRPAAVLGTSKRSVVFSEETSNEEQPHVLKVVDVSDPRGQAAVEREEKALKAVLGSKRGLPQFHGAGNTELSGKKRRVLMTQPIVQPLQAGVDQVVILDIIDALEDLHKAQFSHLDVELRHLGSAIIQDQRRGQIIDLSCSRPLKQDIKPKGYSGTIAYAATSLLDAILDNSEIRIEASLDLESLAKCIIALMIPQLREALEAPSSQDARLYVALGVWHKFESRMPDHSPYIQLITAARGSQYDAMKTIICSLLPNPGWWAEYSKKGQVMDLSMRGQATAASSKTLQVQMESAIGQKPNQLNQAQGSRTQELRLGAHGVDSTKSSSEIQDAAPLLNRSLAKSRGGASNRASVLGTHQGE